MNADPQDHSPREAVSCFARRLVCPPGGAVHAVQCESGRASTHDGRRWLIQISLKQHVRPWGSLGTASDTLVNTNFGILSSDDALQRLPINPSLDTDTANQHGESILRALRDHRHTLPFPFVDKFELWLLHPDSLNPVALLASGSEESRLKLPSLPRWRGISPGARASVSTAESIARLERRVNNLLGARVHAQWFRRDANGRGHALAARHLSLNQDRNDRTHGAERILEAREFPPLGLRAPNDDAAFQALFDVYLDYHAAALLCLPDLPRAARASLEQAAWRQAWRVDAHAELFPEVIDDEGLRVARVEARLRATR